MLNFIIFAWCIILKVFCLLYTQHCSVESLKTLVAFRGPDVSPVSAQGQTPLDLAGLNVNGGK